VSNGLTHSFHLGSPAQRSMDCVISRVHSEISVVANIRRTNVLSHHRGKSSNALNYCRHRVDPHNTTMLGIIETAARRVLTGETDHRAAEAGVVLLDVDRRGRSGSRPRQTTLPSEGATEAHCLWCGRVFAPRATGGSAQKFCCSAHRQSFWIAARRWTMRAVEVGLLSVDCLKASQTSVHAVQASLRVDRDTVA
jgi:hypothetical protein